MNLKVLIFGILFFIAGVLFACGKLHTKIDGWQKMSPEEKAKVNERAMCLNFGAIISLCGVIFILAGAIPAFLDKGFTWAMVAWIAICFGDLFLVSKKKLFEKSTDVVEK